MTDRFGVYVHIPFCAARCDYCAFATWTDRHHLIDSYIAACRAEVERQPLLDATSVFVGGGTPSQVPGEQLASLLSIIPVTDDAEVTVECNPDDATRELFECWRSAGVTRVSLGVQSTQAHVLASLGRTHDPAAVAEAAALVRSAGFDSWNLDLIFGAAGETDEDWCRTVEEVLALDPPHVSAYALTVEPATPLAAMPERHPDDDALAERYLIVDGLLSDSGRPWYEISNWARPGHECRHNRLYWDQGDYRGFGCAAHSHIAGRRFWNVRTPERYIAAIGSGRSPTAGEERLDAPARAEEALVLALRTARGVPVDALDGEDPALEGLVEGTGDGRSRLTPKGRLLHSEVALRLRADRCGTRT